MPAYLSGTAGANPAERIAFAVDALWHLPPTDAITMARELDVRRSCWLESPLYPEDVAGHAALAAAIATPIAFGESYRTLAELRPFLSIANILQPDLGRVGISGFMKIAGAFAGRVVPHLSIAMGPQVAAAIQVAAAASNCDLCEYNPNVLATANAFLATPLECTGGLYTVPTAPGIGIEWNDRGRALVERR